MSPNAIRDSFLEKLHNTNTEPLIMGIINATPDSFYAHSAVQGRKALELALQYEAEGADIIDIGGESSRPGASYIPENEELERVIPVVSAIRERSSIPISVDTRKFTVAREALKRGANCINDISALRDDPALADLIADHKAMCILMHMKGKPSTMQIRPHYDSIIQEITGFLKERSEFAISRGVPKNCIILDPGIGFGKSYADNVTVLKNLCLLKNLKFPLLIGHSRKSFIGWMLAHGRSDSSSAHGSAHSSRSKFTSASVTNNPPQTDIELRKTEERLYGSLGIVADSYYRGVRIFRVHDVAATRDLLHVIHRMNMYE